MPCGRLSASFDHPRNADAWKTIQAPQGILYDLPGGISVGSNYKLYKSRLDSPFPRSCGDKKEKRNPGLSPHACIFSTVCWRELLPLIPDSLDGERWQGKGIHCSLLICITYTCPSTMSSQSKKSKCRGLFWSPVQQVSLALTSSMLYSLEGFGCEEQHGPWKKPTSWYKPGLNFRIYLSLFRLGILRLGRLRAWRLQFKGWMESFIPLVWVHHPCGSFGYFLTHV